MAHSKYTRSTYTFKYSFFRNRFFRNRRCDCCSQDPVVTGCVHWDGAVRAITSRNEEIFMQQLNKNLKYPSLPDGYLVPASYYQPMSKALIEFRGKYTTLWNPLTTFIDYPLPPLKIKELEKVPDLFDLLTLEKIGKVVYWATSISTVRTTVLFKKRNKSNLFPDLDINGECIIEIFENVKAIEFYGKSWIGRLYKSRCIIRIMAIRE